MSVDLKNFKTYRPVDPSDPGFEIVGARLRWVSGRARENNTYTSMYWVPVRKSQLPKELVAHIERVYPNAFADGDTIRRGGGELTLAYCDHETARRLERENVERSREQQTPHRVMPKQEYVGKRDYAKLTEYEESASSIPRQFLKGQKEE